jgi:hypothetical protein
VDGWYHARNLPNHLGVCDRQDVFVRRILTLFLVGSVQPGSGNASAAWTSSRGSQAGSDQVHLPLWVCPGGVWDSELFSRR